MILTTTKMAQGELNASEVFQFLEGWFLNKILRLEHKEHWLGIVTASMIIFQTQFQRFGPSVSLDLKRSLSVLKLKT